MAETKRILDTAEGKRVEESRIGTVHWWGWGPYLSERQWGTVREDYSQDGSAWSYFSHDHARSRVYRWGEDGIAGISDSGQYLCFSVALWNGKDPILKERLFGLTGEEGNHGEDVKEYYYYLANIPSHGYMKYLYKYPQSAYPYDWLVEANKGRGRGGMEFELIDTGVFDEDRYFDVYIEYAKNTPEDILIKVEVHNRSRNTEKIYLLPTFWFRNTWSWGYEGEEKPLLKLINNSQQLSTIEANHHILGKRWLYCENANEILFTENETNMAIFNQPNSQPYVKDGIGRYIINGEQGAVNPEFTGTKAAACYVLEVEPGKSKIIRLRISNIENIQNPFGQEFSTLFSVRESEMEEFYNSVCPYNMTNELRDIQKQAFSGMLWNKQFYYFIVKQWLDGDPAYPPPASERKNGRNKEWVHLHNRDILSMPDKWEYPWFAAWDTAFHTVSFAMIDPEYAKQQLYLFTREWYMHPNGQIPAYEWAFGDINPPVTGWAVLNVYNIEGRMYGRYDTEFLKRMFKRLLLYFTWWVNRKDTQGNNVFEGGFLGLDNVSLFDRSNSGIKDGIIEQSDGTAWMGMFCLNMLRIASEIAKTDDVYNEWCGKFLQHFLYIADAMNSIGGDDVNLWDEDDKFYYDVLRIPGEIIPIKVRSIVGVIPLLAVDVLDIDKMLSHKNSGFSGFMDDGDIRSKLEWYMGERPDLTRHENISIKGVDNEPAERSKEVFLSLVNPERLKELLVRLLDENEFLSPYGIRSLSKYHLNNPVNLHLKESSYTISYEPAESQTAMFGGNSNWRGPIWFPINYMIIQALESYYKFFGDDFKVECPTGSGRMMTLLEVSKELTSRLIKIFTRDWANGGKRPVFGGVDKFQTDPYWKDYLMFYEYFHGDNGAGIGASHQTGWTGLIAKLIEEFSE